MNIKITINCQNVPSTYVDAIVCNIKKIARFSDPNSHPFPDLPKWLLELGPGPMPVPGRPGCPVMSSYMETRQDWDKRCANFFRYWQKGALDDIAALELYKDIEEEDNVLTFKTHIPENVPTKNINNRAVALANILPFVLAQYCTEDDCTTMISGSITMSDDKSDSHLKSDTTIRFRADSQHCAMKGYIQPPETQEQCEQQNTQTMKM